jgi:hypothetical protein
LNNTHASGVLQNPIKSINIGTKAPLPPPIFIRDVIEFTSLYTKLIELIGVDNFYCKASTDRLKIMTANPESYKILDHFLREEKAEFHTFQFKEDKPLRVVIRNLHPTTSTELIKSELKQRLFDVRQVSKVLHKINKHHFYYSLWTLNHSPNLIIFLNFRHFFTQELN